MTHSSSDGSDAYSGPLFAVITPLAYFFSVTLLAATTIAAVGWYFLDGAWLAIAVPAVVISTAVFFWYAIGPTTLRLSGDVLTRDSTSGSLSLNIGDLIAIEVRAIPYSGHDLVLRSREVEIVIEQPIESTSNIRFALGRRLQKSGVADAVVTDARARRLLGLD